LSPQKLDELLKNCEKLKDYGVDFFDRVVQYVLDGADEAVLGELAGKPDAAAALHLLVATRYGGVQSDPWKAFLQVIEPVDCRFYLRLAKVFEAAAKPLPANHLFCQSELDNNIWLEILLQESTQTCSGMWTSERRSSTIPASLIEEMLLVDGRSVVPFVESAFKAGADKYNTAIARHLVLGIKALGGCFAAHRDVVTPFLREGPALSRQIAVENLARTATPVQPFIEELVECATDSAKLLREAAEPLVRSEPEAARPLLEKAAADPKAAKREQAVRLLGWTYGDGARSLLEEMQATEKSAAVKEAIANALRELQSKAAVATEAIIEPPPHEAIELHPPVTPALRDCFEMLFTEYNQFAAEHNQRLAARTQGQYFYPNQPLATIDGDPANMDGIVRLLEQGGAVQGIFAKSLAHATKVVVNSKGAFRTLLEHPDLQLIHLVRFFAMIQLLDPQFRHWGGMHLHTSNLIDAYRRCHKPKITLFNLAEALRAVGMPDDVLIHHMLEGHAPAFRWEPEAVWPFVVGKAEILEKTFEPAGGDWHSRWRRKRSFDNALRLLAAFPQVPPALVGKLWEMAIGTNRADRLRAQKIVVKLPDLSDRLVQALSARGSETRAIAAEWMGRLGDYQYVAPLHKAAKSEKYDAALDEMLTALERLGEDVEPYLDRDKLLADAQKGIKKGTPPALEWFPWARLPTVHWQDRGDAVPAEIVTWLLVQNFKLKSPEAGPLLRRYCAMMRPADRAELGQFVLGAWLDQDLKRKYSDAECRAKAQQQAPAQWQLLQRSLQWYQQQGQTSPGNSQQTLQQVEDSIVHNLQREVGSATGEKGILAVAGACCDSSAVGPVQKYVKDWYGYRAAQCKALIAMLSSIDHPSATQFLLSIANRFRTKGIREEAEKYVNALAERKGWTLDELADRTLPTAGFDDNGRLELSFGPRTFQLRVTPSLEVALTDPEGKTLKAPPAPRKDDDEEQAKAAKKAFSAAKAELKKFAALQTTRLYEAMCTQRTWTVADWRTYLLDHPLMKFLCQRIVWAVCDGDRVQSTFRPLDDGTFTNFEDGEVQLPTGAKVRIAHSCQVPAEMASAWAAHLADYSVAPLFTQFGRTTYVLPEDKRKETAINEFEGHMVEAFKLRSLATKFGYTRGQAQDGGWFFDYIKSFPGMGLRIVLNFSGNGLPEENRSVALKDISFQQAADEEAAMTQMPGGMGLDEVPAVLLSEC